MTSKRAAIVASPDFIALFNTARARMKNPKRKLCINRRHLVCAANAHVGDIRSPQNRYTCYPCWRLNNNRWKQSPAGRAYFKAWYASGAGRAWFRKWYLSPFGRASCKASAHALKARRLGISGRWTATEFLALCDKYNNRCLCCGKHELLTPDHIVPLVLGGRNTIDNLQPLCGVCNSAKYTDTTDYRKNPHPNCLKASKRCKPKKVSAPKPAHAAEEDLHAGIF